MFRKILRIHRNESGITGLETAIILIAFVVVAAVFAYTVLSAGLFSTQKGQEAVYAGLEQAQNTLQMKGSVVAYKGSAAIDSSVGKVQFTVTGSAKNREVIDLTPPYTTDGSSLTAGAGTNPTIISYNDVNTVIAEIPWTLSWIGKDNGDNMLDANEQAVITVWLHDYQGGVWGGGGDTNPPFLASNRVDTYHTFRMEMKPSKGAALTIERTTPALLDTVVDLH